MMNIYAKLLNGDLLHIALPPHSSVSLLKSHLYAELLNAPFGSIVLRHLLPEFEETDDEVSQLMRMGEALTADICDPSRVLHLVDDMTVLVLVDPTTIQPSILKEDDFLVQKRRGIDQLDKYTIRFHCTDDGSLISSVSIVYDWCDDRWAIASTFRALPVAANEDPLYKCTAETKWYSEITDCLLDAPHNIPHDQDILSEIERQFDRQQWVW